MQRFHFQFIIIYILTIPFFLGDSSIVCEVNGTVFFLRKIKTPKLTFIKTNQPKIHKLKPHKKLIPIQYAQIKTPQVTYIYTINT